MLMLTHAKAFVGREFTFRRVGGWALSMDLFKNAEGQRDAAVFQNSGVRTPIESSTNSTDRKHDKVPQYAVLARTGFCDIFGI